MSDFRGWRIKLKLIWTDHVRNLVGLTEGGQSELLVGHRE